MRSLIELGKQSSPLTKSSLQQQIILQQTESSTLTWYTWNNSTFNLVQQHYGRVSLIESVKYVPRCALVPTLRSLYTAGGKSILLFLSVVVCASFSRKQLQITQRLARAGRTGGFCGRTKFARPAPLGNLATLIFMHARRRWDSSGERISTR